jgi:hypothetical protein
MYIHIQIYYIYLYIGHTNQRFCSSFIPYYTYTYYIYIFIVTCRWIRVHYTSFPAVRSSRRSRSTVSLSRYQFSSVILFSTGHLLICYFDFFLYLCRFGWSVWIWIFVTHMVQFYKVNIIIKDFTRAISIPEERQYSEFQLRCLYRRASVYYDLKKYNCSIKVCICVYICIYIHAYIHV